MNDTARPVNSCNDGPPPHITLKSDRYFALALTAAMVGSAIAGATIVLTLAPMICGVAS